MGHLLIGKGLLGAVHRVLRGVLSNTRGDAGRTEVEVELVALADDIALDIRDRGPGVDPATVRVDAPGIAGMRERSEPAGGSFELASGRHGSGTVLRLSLPIQTGGLA